MKNLMEILIELEEHLFQPDVRSSSSELVQLISDDFIEIGASGLRFGKANVLARLPTEVAPEITASNYELRMFGLDCAQLLYKAKMSKLIIHRQLIHIGVQSGVGVRSVSGK